MPIPSFSLIAAPEFITAAEAVEMAIERFRPSNCTEAEACAWLSEEVLQRKLKLHWTDTDSECFGSLQLDGEGFISIPRFLPAARTIDEVGWGAGLAIDELDWSAGELRRRVRYPKPGDREGGAIDPFKLTAEELLARYRKLDTLDEPEEWVTEELKYRFTVRRASLVAILDRASVPLGTVRVALLEAGKVIASRFNLSHQIGLEAIIEAAAAERIEVYGKAQPDWQTDRIDPRVWRRVARGEATLSADALLGEPRSVAWSDPYVFRGDLERLVRELAGGSAAAETETGPAEPVAGAAECRADPASDTSGVKDDAKDGAPRDTVALRGRAKEWLAAYVNSGAHRDRDSTLKAMCQAHPGLSVRGSLAVWSKFSKDHPNLQLSRRGAKLKRNTNN
jgi:hypothetical protein